MVPLLLVARRQPDFGAYYPFYRSAGRSWADFLAWEAIYAAQFLALEAFFRGWWLHATRTLGAASILGMVLPYAMIHFGKPWLEVSGAIVAGVVLGSLSARTRSIWAGFLVHATVGLLMALLSLEQRGALPTRAWQLGAGGLVQGAGLLAQLQGGLVVAEQQGCGRAAEQHQLERPRACVRDRDGEPGSHFGAARGDGRDQDRD